MSITEISTDQAPKPVSAYSQALLVEQQPLLFLSGQIGIDPANGKLIQGGIVNEVQQVLKNIENILIASGCTWNNIVRCEIFLTDMNEHFHIFNQEYAKLFVNARHMPARQTIGVAALPLGAAIEISCIATVNSLSTSIET